MGAAILDRKSWGPLSWTGSDVIYPIVAPILLTLYNDPNGSFANTSQTDGQVNVFIFHSGIKELQSDP